MLFVHSQVTEELEGVKAEMDEKGTSMTDAGPLVRVKQALTRLKTECTQMDIRIGVVSKTTSLILLGFIPTAIPSLPAFRHATLKSWERGPGDEAKAAPL